MVDLTQLPGGERAASGLEDLRAGRHTVDALWVAIAASRLRALGLAVPEVLPEDEPELALYALLCERERDHAYVMYNALIQELQSLTSALEAEMWRERRRVR